MIVDNNAWQDWCGVSSSVENYHRAVTLHCHHCQSNPTPTPTINFGQHQLLSSGPPVSQTGAGVETFRKIEILNELFLLLPDWIFVWLTNIREACSSLHCHSLINQQIFSPGFILTKFPWQTIRELDILSKLPANAGSGTDQYRWRRENRNDSSPPREPELQSWERGSWWWCLNTW